ncbi:MAG TPA: PH domain-containing protein [Propionibacteriaceae bacterium]
MGLPTKLLCADEHEVIHTRTHAKALVLPALALVLVGAAVGAGAALVPSGARPIGQLAVVVLGLVLVIWWVVKPFLRWRTTTYTVTNRRLITRRGILNRSGTDIPLNRVHEISSDRSLSDRMFGCGTLNIQTAAEAGTVVLHDVPEVEHVHAAITELLFGPDQGR